VRAVPIASVCLAACIAGCTLLTDFDGLEGGAADGGAAIDGAVDAAAPTPPPVPASPPDAGHDADADADAGIDAGPYASAVLADSPLAFYRFDDPPGSSVAKSAVGPGLDAVVSGSASLAGPGLVGAPSGGAATFAAKIGAGTIRVPRDTRIEPTAAVSVELWYARTEDTGASEEELVAYGEDAVENAPYAVYLQPPHVVFYLGQPNGGGSKTVSADVTFEIGVPRHFVATYDGFAMSLYVDGKLAASGPATGALTGYDGINGLAFGSDYLGNFPLTGIVDEVAVYGAALSPARVLAHYEASR
jgi:hypothetical protein